jgi:hypothetical protein
VTEGDPDMTPFVEVPLDPNWPDSIRATVASQSEEFFLRFFNGRVPSAQEKLEYIENSVRFLTPLRAFQNNLYRVEIADTPPFTPTFVHLAISRLDRGTCNEWADLQRIKNEIVGPEYEAIELFPAESRLVNTGNEYHLWVHSDPHFRFPVGWQQRMVFSDPVPRCDAPLRIDGWSDNAATQAPIPVGRFRLTPMERKN